MSDDKSLNLHLIQGCYSLSDVNQNPDYYRSDHPEGMAFYGGIAKKGAVHNSEGVISDSPLKYRNSNLFRKN